MSQEEDLKQLYDDIQEDPDFDTLRRPNIRFVPGKGPMNPDLMLIGEAPGKLENAKLAPFVGTAGTNLDGFLSEIGVNRRNIFLTNVVKYWPLDFNSPKFNTTRTPTGSEVEAARDYLKEEIDIVAPKLVGLCGVFALTTLFPEHKKIITVHGQLLENHFVPLYHPAVPSYHPHRMSLVREGYMKLGEYLNNLNKKAS